MQHQQTALFLTHDLHNKAQEFTGNKQKAIQGENMFKDAIYRYLLDKQNAGASHLGDRTTYIGSSDYCERAAYLKRVRPIIPDLETLMRFERGRFFEKLMSDALRHNKIQHTQEHEIIHPDKPHIKAHCDFTMVKETQNEIVVGILECKDVDGIPGGLYQGWDHQLTHQTGLTKLVFGQKTKKKVTVKAVLIAKDAGSGQMKVFNRHKYNESAFHQIVHSADNVWAALQKDTDDALLKTKAGTLCSYCEYLDDCPSFWDMDTKDLSAIESELQDYSVNSGAAKTHLQAKKKAQQLISSVMGNETRGTANNTHVKMVRIQDTEVTDFQDLEDFLSLFAPKLLSHFKIIKKGYTYPRITTKNKLA